VTRKIIQEVDCPASGRCLLDLAALRVVRLAGTAARAVRSSDNSVFRVVGVGGCTVVGDAEGRRDVVVGIETETRRGSSSVRDGLIPAVSEAVVGVARTRRLSCPRFACGAFFSV
jgi:hypothetical protein